MVIIEFRIGKNAVHISSNVYRTDDAVKFAVTLCIIC